MAIKTQTLNGPDLYGYLAEPETGARGGVLIYPTIFAVNDFVRGYAETLARAGLAAAVWDIYSGLPLVTDYQESLKRARMLDDAGVADMTGKWIDHMFGAMGLASVGVLGFCIGGRYALLQAAADKRLKACAMAYPSIENPRLANQDQDALTLAADIACPVHLLHAGKDHVTEPPTYQLLHEALHARSAPTIVQFHPLAEHGFMHRKEPEANRIATALASPQLIAFLQTCLA